MTRFSSTVALSLVLLGTLYTPPAFAQARSEVTIRNQSNEWTWITLYNRGKSQLGSYCVQPHDTNRRWINGPLDTVRAEVTTGRNCAHPKVYDKTLPATAGLPFTGTVINWKGGYSFGGWSHH